MKKIDKLYAVFSPMPSFDNKERCVSVWWYRGDKVRDGFKYGKVIEGYNDMTPEDKRRSEFCVNYLFSSDEVESLRHFLEVELERELEVEFEYDPTQPIWEQDYYGPHSDTGTDSDGTIYLNMLENYNLPFEVRGSFIKAAGDPILKHWMADTCMKPTTKD